MSALNALLQVRRYLEEEISAVELLKQTPLTRLEEMVKGLKKHRTAAEMRKAMVERIARAPLSEFEALKTIYLKYCGDATEKS
jgi:16S rRNA C1402 N4-methylase RsmH